MCRCVTNKSTIASELHPHGMLDRDQRTILTYSMNKITSKSYRNLHNCNHHIDNSKLKSNQLYACYCICTKSRKNVEIISRRISKINSKSSKSINKNWEMQILLFIFFFIS